VTRLKHGLVCFVYYHNFDKNIRKIKDLYKILTNWRIKANLWRDWIITNVCSFIAIEKLVCNTYESKMYDVKFSKQPVKLCFRYGLKYAKENMSIFHSCCNFVRFYFRHFIGVRYAVYFVY
jgi:hypothetical protein